ncbi:MAG: hypothetical protein ACLURP_16645 [Ruminococcus sp.]
MTILKCSATTCAYNEDMLCSRGKSTSWVTVQKVLKKHPAEASGKEPGYHEQCQKQLWM